MYSRRVVDLVIEDWAKEVDHQGKRVNFEPRYHTIAEIDEFNDYLSRQLKNDGNNNADYYIWKDRPPTTERIRWIKKWIKNERFLCFADAEYFVTRYAKIRAVDEQIIRFELRIGQKIFLKILQEYDDAQRAIQIFVLKCRHRRGFQQ